MKATLFTLFFIGLFASSCTSQTPKNVQVIEPNAFAEKLNNTQNPQLIDVRTPEEFAVEHLKNATNINWNSPDFIANVEKLDQSKPVFVYCKVGGRSSQAAAKLAELGFKEIYNLNGGIMKWTGEKISDSTSITTGFSFNDYLKLINSDKKVVVNFFAEWCAPCKKMTPYMIKLADELKGKIQLYRLDADQNKGVVDSLKLDGLPVIIIYENGKEVWRHTGYLSEEALRKQL
jgi:thioredoxin